MRKVAVLISGRGSNLQALIDACAQPGYPAEIVHVVSNRADAAGLERATSAGIATSVVRYGDYGEREAFDAAISDILMDAGAEIVCLAGFMRILTPGFVQTWHDRLINIHPSLLPAFKGLDAQRQALEAGVRITGCTVHFVRAEMDVGPIIAQAAVPVLPDDDEASLSARILAQEHLLYPQALQLIAEGRARVEGERVVLDRAAAPESTLRNPPS